MKFSLVINLDNVKQYFNYIWDSANKRKNLHLQHSYDILGARMLWKPKEARILKNF